VGTSYNMLKKRASSSDDPERQHETMSAMSYLVCSAQASEFAILRFLDAVDSDYSNTLLTGVATAILTNPIWVVKVRMFTTKPASPTSYRNLFRMS
jgi:solute carrier family 25 (mitochondrial folate transporter), member 32